MPHPNDLLLGQLAIRAGLISPDQLREGLRRQEESAGKPLGVILVQQGLVGDEVIHELLEMQYQLLLEPVEFTKIQKRDALLGKILVHEKVVGDESISQALRIQAQMYELGFDPVPRLGEILIKRGLITEEALKRVLSLQEERAHVCPHCGSTLGPRPPGAPIAVECPRCNGVFSD